nr:K(+) efflux antiporter 3, chloroplastic [Tanacetum cinerariifolium]
MLVKESLKALGGLGLLSFGGKFFLRRIFEAVAEARSSEAFVALCLLTVAGTSLITQKLGFSDTLGAFLAGALLAETNFRTQIEADIRPFRGLLLGLFFVTTGTSIDTQLLIREWPNDIAVVPLLVILPVLETQALGGLGLLSFGGKFFLRRIFEAVAEARSPNAFVALCLLTVPGTSLITQKLGFSDTGRAFTVLPGPTDP